MSDHDSDDEINGNNYHEIDELVDFPHGNHDDNHNGNQIKSQDTSARRINLILDPSAFTRGIGNIKRWYNKEYVTDRDERIKNQNNIINLYIPSYTLHEFDYLKKGTSMIATYARQSIRFIDELFEHDLTEFSINDNFHLNLLIESPAERGPPWHQCQTFQIHNPKIKEFPNFKTKFDGTIIGKKHEEFDELSNFLINDNHKVNHNHQRNSVTDNNNNNINDIQYENSESYLKAAANSENFAIMPPRLKYLISSCIFKKFIQPHNFKNPLEEWKLISEDSITKIWGKSFGIDCMNVNEAELLIFQSYDVNKLYNPHVAFSLDDNNNPDSILQDTIDTSLYAYTKLEAFKSNKSKSRSKSSVRSNANDNASTGATAKSRSHSKASSKSKSKNQGNVNNHNSKSKVPNAPIIKGVTQQATSDLNGEVIKKERFDAINYAPRGHGELWKP